MPRKQPLSKTDIEIARRLIKLRLDHHLSRGDLARKTGLSADAITRIELRIMPVRYTDACKYLSAFTHHDPYWPDLHPINPLWLLEGAEPMQIDWPLLLPMPDQLGLKHHISFSDFVASNRELIASLTRRDSETILPEMWLRPYLFHWLKLNERERKLGIGSGFVQWLFQNSAKTLAPTSPEARLWLERYSQAKIEGKLDLTETETSDNHLDVKPKLPSLLERLIQATKETGRMTELAKFLDVPLASVSRWLSGKREPGGEITLKMLHWVEQQERQTKKP